MKYKITTSYNWYKTEDDKFIILTYYINGFALTFDEILEEAQNDPEISKRANEHLTYDPEFFYQKSFYLIDEQCHPCIFEMELENPEALDEIN